MSVAAEQRGILFALGRSHVAERPLEAGAEAALAHRGRLVALRPVDLGASALLFELFVCRARIFGTGQGGEKSDEVVFFGFAKAERQ